MIDSPRLLQSRIPFFAKPRELVSGSSFIPGLGSVCLSGTSCNSPRILTKVGKGQDWSSFHSTLQPPIIFCALTSSGVNQQDRIGVVPLPPGAILAAKMREAENNLQGIAGAQLSDVACTLSRGGIGGPVKEWSTRPGLFQSTTFPRKTINKVISLLVCFALNRIKGTGCVPRHSKFVLRLHMRKRCLPRLRACFIKNEKAHGGSPIPPRAVCFPLCRFGFLQCGVAAVAGALSIPALNNCLQRGIGTGISEGFAVSETFFR